MSATRFEDAVAARFELCHADGDDERPLSELAYRVRYERDVALLGRELAWRQLARLHQDERRAESRERPRSPDFKPPSRRVGHAVALATVMSACIVVGALIGLVLGSAPWR